MFILQVFAVIFTCLGLSTLVGAAGGMDMLLLTGPGIKDPLIRQEADAFVEACSRRGIKSPCEAGMRLVTRGEFWADSRFEALPSAEDAVGITYLSVATPFKNIFIKESLKTTYDKQTLKFIIWHELAHAVFLAKHDDTSPGIMNSSFDTHGEVLRKMSWGILEEKLLREFGFAGATKLQFKCSVEDLDGLGPILAPHYCTNHSFF